MKCPSCKTKLEKLMVGGLCPECNAPLKYVERQNSDGEFVKGLAFRKSRDSAGSEEEPERYELIFKQSGVSVEKSNKYNNYIVTYDRVFNFNWVYCPGCESKMFQNNMVNGSLEHKCHKCKAVVNYVFND